MTSFFLLMSLSVNSHGRSALYLYSSFYNIHMELDFSQEVVLWGYNVLTKLLHNIFVLLSTKDNHIFLSVLKKNVIHIIEQL